MGNSGDSSLRPEGRCHREAKPYNQRADASPCERSPPHQFAHRYRRASQGSPYENVALATLTPVVVTSVAVFSWLTGTLTEPGRIHQYLL